MNRIRKKTGCREIPPKSETEDYTLGEEEKRNRRIIRIKTRCKKKKKMK